VTLLKHTSCINITKENDKNQILAIFCLALGKLQCFCVVFLKTVQKMQIPPVFRCSYYVSAPLSLCFSKKFSNVLSNPLKNGYFCSFSKTETASKFGVIKRNNDQNHRNAKLYVVNSRSANIRSLFIPTFHQYFSLSLNKISLKSTDNFLRTNIHFIQLNCKINSKGYF